MENMINFLVLFPFLGAALVWIFGKKNEKMPSALTVAAELLAAGVLAYNCFFTEGGGTFSVAWENICGMGLSFATDHFRVLYVLIASFMWFVSTLFSFPYMEKYSHKKRYYFFRLFTLGATNGIFLSADFFTMFVFFELMSLASYVWVAQDEKKESLKAAETYLAVAVIGGLCFLMGMFLLYGETGDFSTMGLYGINKMVAEPGNAVNGRLVAAGILMLIGFGAKAGAVPLHIWLPKAHPVAPAPASALLSGVLTKTGVFGTMILTLQLFFGNTAFAELILLLGVLTMVTGAVLALFSVNLKRTLACSSVSQIGFILTGLGMAGMFAAKKGTFFAEGFQVALNGTVLHMVNHSLIKLLLFCLAGVVYMNLHKLDFNEIKGYGRKKPLFHVLFLTGAIGIAGVPLFNGYVSKSLIHEGMVIWQEAVNAPWIKAAEWLFIISGGLTVAYMTKIYVVLFLEKSEAQETTEKRCMNPLTAVLFSLTAVLLVIIGIGGGIYFKIFDLESLFGAALSLVIGALVYLFIVRKLMIKDGVYVDSSPKWFDLENGLYRPLLKGFDFVLSILCRVLDRLPDYLVLGLRKTIYKESPLPHELEEGDVITHAVGVVVDDGRKVLNHTLLKNHPVEGSAEHKLAMLREEMKENNTMIARSLSFGLLLFCIGLLFTLIYILVI